MLQKSASFLFLLAFIVSIMMNGPIVARSDDWTEKSENLGSWKKDDAVAGYRVITELSVSSSLFKYTDSSHNVRFWLYAKTDLDYGEVGIWLFHCSKSTYQDEEFDFCYQNYLVGSANPLLTERADGSSWNEVDVIVPNTAPYVWTLAVQDNNAILYSIYYDIEKIEVVVYYWEQKSQNNGQEDSSSAYASFFGPLDLISALWLIPAIILVIPAWKKGRQYLAE